PVLVQTVVGPTTFTTPRAPAVSPRATLKLRREALLVPPSMFQIAVLPETVPTRKSLDWLIVEPLRVVSIPRLKLKIELLTAPALLVDRRTSAWTVPPLKSNRPPFRASVPVCVALLTTTFPLITINAALVPEAGSPTLKESRAVTT